MSKYLSNKAICCKLQFQERFGYFLVFAWTLKSNQTSEKTYPNLSDFRVSPTLLFRPIRGHFYPFGPFQHHIFHQSLLNNLFVMHAFLLLQHIPRILHSKNKDINSKDVNSARKYVVTSLRYAKRRVWIPVLTNQISFPLQSRSVCLK